MRQQAQGLRPGAAAAFIAAFVGIAAAQELPTKTSGQIPELPAIEELTATVERPLFMPNRRPPAEAPPTPVAEAKPVVVPTEESPADLMGIVNGPDRTYVILTSRGTKEVYHLRMGEKIDDWKVQEIGSRYVVLRRGPGSLRLELFAEKEATAGTGEPSLARPPQTLRPRFTQRPRQHRPPQRAQRPTRRPRRGDQD